MDKVVNHQILIVIQFLHLLLFLFTASVFVSVFYYKEGPLQLLALLYSAPIYFIEFVLYFIFKSHFIDKSLPVMSVIVLTYPITLSLFINSSFDVIGIAIGILTILVLILNTLLLFYHSRQLIR